MSDHRRAPSRLALAVLAAVAAGAPVSTPHAGSGDTRTSGAPDRYRPRFRVPASAEAFVQHIAPGRDDFPDEKEAAELAGRLAEIGAALRESPARAADTVARVLADEFEGGRLRPPDERPLSATAAFEVVRGGPSGGGPTHDRAAFVREWTAFLSRLGAVDVAELLITAIDVAREDVVRARTEVRYDLVGRDERGGRAERVGRWAIRWRRERDGAWQVAEWTALEDVVSRASSPVFTEVTEAALGGNASFREQLRTGLDPWLAALDSVFMMDSMGHHGVSAGDADGDGLDDLFLAQPAGLPDRLFRNRGDGTFEDVTEAAGLLVLDDTSQSLFADVDNDGDQDLLLVTSRGPLLFANDGKGRFDRVADAFEFQLEGTPMSLSMADYDRDGFLDAYLCTYSYFIGAGEDKGGLPTPYHDARNGPPNVLFRNDGHGRFVDVTAEAGLDAGNDRFSFAAAWADYDGDGWPDLAVANDFGRKNLYRNKGRKDGGVAFEETTATAGVEDHGAGMSVTWLDYDRDGRLDLYFGNMWTDNGLRITAQPGFMPHAPAEVRDLYRRMARGNTLFRNRGDGTFEDTTLAARAHMGRWAWSSDALDFDSDGFEDLYVVNGMFTRGEGERDLDGLFWRQVVARSPLTRVTGTPYDEAWRTINRLLADDSQASRQRNVLLRNDGASGFDEVSGAAGLDLVQDGRSFAVLDYDRDGDPDLAVMAPRSAPQLRVFRNDFAGRTAALALRLTGTGQSPRDAIGAHVTVETDALRLTRSVMAGSGFISQGSKELLIGLGGSRRVDKVTVRWPSGGVQTIDDLPVDVRVHVVEGGAHRTEPLAAASVAASAPAPPAPSPPGPAAIPRAIWLYDPFPAPELQRPDLDGVERSLSGLRGRPVVLLLWASSSAASRDVALELARAQPKIAAAGASVLAIALDPPEGEADVRAAAKTLSGIPVVLADGELGLAFSLLNRYLFVGKEDLPLPTVLLLDGQGQVTRAHRGVVRAADVVADLGRIASAPADRLARAVPFPGTFHSSPGGRNYLQYALELVEQGLDGHALPAFERAVKGDPSAFTLYSLGTLYMSSGQPEKARGAFERALQVKSDFAEANNGLGALLAQGGNVPAAITRFRAALETTPDYPDALNNLGYALHQTGRESEAHALYLKALELQPDFPEAFNNLGIYFARQGEMPTAESYFKQALEKRPGYGEAGNNLALVLMTHDAADEASAVLTRLLEANPAFEATYVTLAKVYASTHQRHEALQVLERLLQRNPTHPLGLELARELRAP